MMASFINEFVLFYNNIKQMRMIPISIIHIFLPEIEIKPLLSEFSLVTFAFSNECANGQRIQFVISLNHKVMEQFLQFRENVI